MSRAEATEVRPEQPRLPASLRLGEVHLTVADLERSVEWYVHALGLRVDRRDAGGARLGDGLEAVVVLHGDRLARPAGRHAGLYHFALLYPTREELSHAARRLAVARVPVQGMSDHRTHEAIYLADPDGNGIELAADRPREQWPSGLGYDRGPAPLDIASLLAATADRELQPTVGQGLRVGHVHLHVGDLDDALRFYCDIVGFELQAELGTAAFVSAGGYHHHLGVNVWKGRGVGPAPEHTAGLRHWTVVLPTDDEIGSVRARVEAAGVTVQATEGGFRVRDPWGTAVIFTRSRW